MKILYNILKLFNLNFINKFISLIAKFLFLFAFLIIYSIYLNNRTICMCSIGKNENLYIKEFISYYKKLGYNKIFLYDNNDIDEERFEDVLKNEINKGFVSLINYRGFRGSNINPQLNAYKDCYEKNNLKYDWLSFFDIDEYLELIPSSLKINNFLNNKRYAHCQNVKINWVYYTNNNSLYYENKSLEKRVNIPIFNLEFNHLIKSTVRGNLPINYWSIADNPHTSLNKVVACSSSGKIIDYKSPINEPPDYTFAFLKHLQYKSFEEYCLKIKRGRPIKNYKNYREEKIKQLFESNKNNSEKLNILIKIFNSSKFKKNSSMKNYTY